MGHGDHWKAIESNLDLFVEEVLPRILQHGKAVGDAQVLAGLQAGARPRGAVVGLSYLDGALRFLALVGPKGDGGPAMDFKMAYPVCHEGIVTSLVIDRIEEDEDGLEGKVKAHFPGGSLLWFFDPYLYMSKSRYRLGRKAPVRLSALALGLSRIPPDGIQVTSGDILEMHRSRMRAEDPGVDVSAISSVSISLEGSALLLPVSGAEAEVVFEVEEVRELQCDGRPMFRLTGPIRRNEDGVVRLHVFVAPHALVGGAPSPGETLQGTIWLQGQLASEA